MTSQSMTTLNYSSFESFCGGQFWNQSLLSDNWWPEFTPCFLHTILVWLPCGYVWLLLPCLWYHLTSPARGSVARPADKSGTVQDTFHDSPEGSLPSGRITGVLLSKMVMTSMLAASSLSRLVLDTGDGQPGAVVLSSVFLLVTYTLVILILGYERRKGRKSSFVTFYFYLMNVPRGIIFVYTWIITKPADKEAEFTLQVLDLTLNLSCLIAACLPDHIYGNLTETTKENSKVSPEVVASYPSTLFFTWILSFMIKALRREIKMDDMFELNPRDQGNQLNPLFVQSWEEECRRVQGSKNYPSNLIVNTSQLSLDSASMTQKDSDHTQLVNGKGSSLNGFHHLSGKQLKEDTNLLETDRRTFFGSLRSKTNQKKATPALLRVLWKLEWKNCVAAFSRKLFSDVLLFVTPLVIGVLIEVMELKDPARKWQAYVICLLLFFMIVFRSLLFTHSRYASSVLALQIRTMLLSAVYKKAMSMSNAARRSYSAGEIVNLMSVDCQRIQEYLAEFPFLLGGPIQLLFSLIILYVTVGNATIACLVLVVCTIPLVCYFTSRQKLIQDEIMKVKDNRIKTVHEIINSMKILKLYAWEEEFKEKVKVIRAQEVKQLYKVSRLFLGSEVLLSFLPFLLNIVTFAAILLMDRDKVLDPKTAFVSLSVFNLMRLPIVSFKFIISYIVQLSISFQRINDFLVTEDLNSDNTNFTADSEQAVSIRDGTFSWDTSMPPTLWNINVDIADQKLTAIVGPVGCGKSSLVSAILGEMEKIRGQVTVKGPVAYVPQQAWIQNATVRDNILFGQKFNKHRYWKVIKACELERDLQILAAGDLTEIGEKGVNLSGGQKQRVSLARAVYSQSELYLLDDPLSAVDAHVGKAIFKNVMSDQGLLAGKTRVLVTHGIHWLPQVDYILVMSGGQVSEQGSYLDLISHKGDFSRFLATYETRLESVDEDQDDVFSFDHPDVISKSTGLINQPRKDNMLICSFCAARDKQDKECPSVEECLCHEGLPLEHTETLTDRTAGSRGKQTVTENLKSGGVKLDVFVTFVKAAGPYSLALAFIVFLLHKVLMVWANFFLLDWTQNPLPDNATRQEVVDRQNYYLAMYGAFFGLAQLLTLVIYNYFYWQQMVRASHRLHNLLVDRLFHAPMSFFDQTPIGQILNRLSKDVDTCDTTIPVCLNDSTMLMSVMVLVLVTVLILTPLVVAILLPVIALFVVIQKCHARTVRQLKRIESITRSPIFNHMSESFTGAAVIRAYQVTQRFRAELERKVDINQIYFFTNQIAYSWLQLALESLAGAVVFMAGALLILDNGNGADMGLSMSGTLQLSLGLNFMIKQINEIQSSSVAVERILEYTTIEQEAELVKPDNRPDPSWPMFGEVTFSDYQTRYRPDLDLVLRGITCHINSGEKVGVVGRTGAGKSSLTFSLFRLIEAVSGSIVIDGVNIADIGLHDLRNKLTILPQDPVIFSGSLRLNIDPFLQYSEQDLWTALERAHLKFFVSSQARQLNMECGHEGSSLSVGQRQLVCLTRALLRHTKVLILDEATAAVDMETDALIQKTIREAFRDCTIIAIAHRLNTIMEYDRIIVMDAGIIREFDTPTNLLNRRGMFYDMCRDAGLVL